MSKFTSRLAFFVFVCALALGSSPASAARPRWSFAGELGRAAWSLLFGDGTAVAPKLGCSIDPDGTPASGQAPKRGCDIDPNGAPASATPKAGCSINPDGTPRCTP